MGLDKLFRKTETPSKSPEERLEKVKEELRREMADLRAGADRRERDFEKIARARAGLEPIEEETEK